LEALPDQIRRLLALAAADPSGDPSLVWRTAGRLGIPVQAVAEEAGLVEFGGRVGLRLTTPRQRPGQCRWVSGSRHSRE